jgi:23S rRNA (cytidine1920-2'-O)/16S rRNA (cytidine1409-2'-O)-methyltransferase
MVNRPMTSAPKKIRLDLLVCERGLAASREKAQALIMAGEVWSLERRLDKPGQTVAADLPLSLRGESLPFVSRAGLKLDHALNVFGVDVRERVALDVGASTGGFTDCLLQRGAKHVFALDVGYGQLDVKLRHEPRVTCLEKVNVRNLTANEVATWSGPAGEIDLVTIDVSFISLEKVLLPLRLLMRPKPTTWILLFKPQFEVGPEALGNGGVVRRPEFTVNALNQFRIFMENHEFRYLHGPESSPIAGKKSGNLEYLCHYETL